MSANNDTLAIETVMRKMMITLDTIRHESFKELTSSSPSSQLKKVMGMTVRQSAAMSRLHLLMQDEPQGIALKILAQHMQMTVPAASLLVETMVNKGFFERNPNPNDRRAVCIRLSEKGEQLIASVSAEYDRRIVRHGEEVTQEELQTCLRVAEKIHASIIKHSKKIEA